MTNTQLLLSCTALGLPAAAFATRQILAKALIAAVIKNAEPDIKKFKDENMNLAPLSKGLRPSAHILYDYVSHSHTKRDAEMGDLEKVRIERPNITFDMSVIGTAKVDNKKIFMDVMKNSSKHRIRHAFRDTVKYRLELLRASKAAAAAVAAAAAGDAVASDPATNNIINDRVLNEAYKHIKEQAEPHLDLLEEKVMQVFDEFGFIDATVEIVENTKEFMKDHYGDAIAHKAESIADAIGNFEALPASLTSLRSIGREAVLLIDGDTTLGDAAKNAATTVALKTVGIKVGVALDTMTMGISFGAFTVLCSFGTAMLRNGILEEENRELIARYESLYNQLHAAYSAAMQEIERIAQEFDTEYLRRVSLYPDINEEENLKNWVGELLDAYDKGLEQSTEALTGNAKAAIEDLPKKNWVDRALFIDRTTTLKDLYLKAQREITSEQSGITYDFRLAAATHADKAVKFLMDHVTFNTAAFSSALSKIEDVSVKCEKNYEFQMIFWRQEFNDFCEQEGSKAADLMNGEAADYDKYKSQIVPEMKGLSHKISTNRKRLGLKAAPSPAAA